MDKKLVIIIVIAILIIVIVPLGLTLYNANSTPQSNTTVQNDTTLNDTPSNDTMGIVATVKGPKTAKRGQNITIECTISNKGTKTVYNLTIEGQNIDTKNLETLKAGETRKFTEIEYILTDSEVASNYGIEGSSMNPFPVGGDAVYFQDAKGTEHVIQSSWIKIKLT